MGRRSSFPYGPLPLVPAVAKPGIIPLQPLTLNNIFNDVVDVLFAPVPIALERLPVTAVITRSFTLARNNLWRVLGIQLLAFLVEIVVADTVTVPFAIAENMLLTQDNSDQYPAPVHHNYVHRVGDRSNHYHAIQCRMHRTALHRSTNARRSIRPGAEDRCRRRTLRGRIHRQPLANLTWP